MISFENYYKRVGLLRKVMQGNKHISFSAFRGKSYSHFFLLLSWVVFLALYVITEACISVDSCYVMHTKLDDIIPFCELFLIPYVFWYFLVAGSLIYFAFHSVDSFKKLQYFIIITQIVAMLVYIIFPNMQNLRPESFPRNNILTKGVDIIYRIDTNTNVCPSLHVAYSVGVVSAWLKEERTGKLFKLFITISAILICLSTVFIKQHSVIDGVCAIILCIITELVVYGGYWKMKLNKTSHL